MHLLDKPVVSELYAVRGDTLTCTWSFESSSTGDEADGVGIDLTGDVWRFTVTDPLDGTVLVAADSVPTDADQVIEVNADAVDGRIRLTVAEAVAEGLPVTIVRGKKVRTHLRFDWQRTTAAGLVETPWVGELLVEQDESLPP